MADFQPYAELKELALNRTVWAKGLGSASFILSLFRNEVVTGDCSNGSRCCAGPLCGSLSIAVAFMV